MSKCFVIQPFDGGKFDKRFFDTYKPAIEECGVEAYRVDMDTSSVIPIEDIDNGIKNSVLCLVDITEDNPNVWFELGLAIAYLKNVILICSAERTTKFPFDVQHRKIIKYANDSASDYEKLKQQIKERIKIALSQTDRIATISKNIQTTEGLEPYEIVVLITIGSNIDSPESGVPVWTIRTEMEKAGYTKIAATLGLKRLLNIDYLSFSMDSDQNGNDYTIYTLTDKGMEWLLNNKDKLVLQINEEIAF